MSRNRLLKLAEIEAGEVRLGPGTLHIDVTNSCNTNCITCWDHSPLLEEPRSAVWKRTRVEVQSTLDLLDDVVGLGGLRSVILSGMGEPFTHPDIYRIIEAVKARGLHLTIITNLIAADPVRVVELGVDTLLIGIHGASKESYEEFHPSFKNGEWELLREILEYFRSEGRRDKHVHVICNTNAAELSEMVTLAREYRAERVNFKLAGLFGGTERARISGVQRALLKKCWIPEAEDLARRLTVRTNTDLLRRQLEAGEEATAPIGDVGCFMGYVYARVLVDGTVLYCCSTEVAVGNLGDGVRFSELWHGPRWDALRARLRRGDYFPSCAQCGKFYQNVDWGKSFAAEYGDARRDAVSGKRGPA